MSDESYSVIFAGELVDGADGKTVRENLAKLFKADPARIETMFSGKRVMIKNKLDKTQAAHYQTVLAKAGAVVEIFTDSPAPEATPEPKPAAAPAAPTTLEKAESNEPPPPPVAPDLTVAEVGATLVEHEPVAPAQFDTTQFDLAELGADLVEYQHIEPPDFDTSTMTLEPVGADLSEPRNVPPANFDTSGLSLTDEPQ